MPIDPKRVQAIFLMAVGTADPASRAELLDRECGDDRELRQRVEALLKAHDDAGGFLWQPIVDDLGGVFTPASAGARLEQPALAPPPGRDERQVAPTVSYLPITEGPGTIIGRYKLLQKIGEGGFGVVYMAEQEEPIRRRVALKIIKLGMDTSEVIGRFEAERQALALMDHPNIARVLDAGATSDKPEAPAKVVTGATDKPEAPAKDVDDSPSLALQACRPGRPYFVMELVRGVRITEYCDKNHLSVRERLELFTQVCNAVQHAHQKGIIHRDIKPSNVMVTLHDGVPVPKVIDFGVAKATQARLTERTVFTQYGHFIGTPAYMSPEQAEMSGLDVDTRSDIYSLGVLLYELLTGTTPIEETRLREAGYLELQRLIREEEPPKPSTRLSQSGEALPSICAQRGTEPKKLGKLLRGDLDWIVMKALEKDRTHRYGAASEFAADIQRHLNLEAVLAGPPSVTYRLRRYLRKHRGPVAAAGSILATLVGGLAVSLALYFRAETLRQEANTARSDLQDSLTTKDQALTQRDAALAQRTNALKAYEHELQQKEAALRRSECLRFAALSSSLLPENPGLALLLAVEGATRGPRIGSTNNALLAAMRACNERRTLVGHAGKVLLAVFSPDGKRVLTSSWDGTARMWDVATGDTLVAFSLVKGTSFSPVCAAFSSDGRRVVTAFEGYSDVRTMNRERKRFTDRAARIWDSQTGKELVILRGHEDRIVSVQFSPDGQRVLTASWDKTARIWDAATGRQLAVLVGHNSSLLSASFSADGKRVLTIGSSRERSSNLPFDAGVAIVKSRKSRPSPQHSSLHTEDDDSLKLKVGIVKSSPKRSSGFPSIGQRMEATFSVVGSSGSGEPSASIDPPAMEEAFQSVGGATTALAASHQPSPEQYDARIWNARTGELITPIARSPGFALFLPRFQRMILGAFQPDGKRVFTVREDGLTVVWDADTGKELFSWRTKAPSVDWAGLSPCGRVLLTYDSDGTARLWDVDTGKNLAMLKGNVGASIARFTPDGKAVVTHRGVWDVSTGEQVAVFKGHDSAVDSLDVKPDGKPVVTFVTHGHWLSPFAVDVSSDGHHVVTASADKTARIWSLRPRVPFETVLAGHTNQVTTADFSPDGRLVVTASEDKSARIWDAETGRELGVLKGTVDLPKEAQASPPMAARKRGVLGALWLWINPDQRMSSEYISRNVLGKTRVAAFSPDGKKVITVSSDNRAFILTEPPDWKGDTEKFLASIGPEAQIPYTPVRLWDVPTHGQLVRLRGHSASIRGGVFSPDGRSILTCEDVSRGWVVFHGLGSGTGSQGGSLHNTNTAARIFNVRTGQQHMALQHKGAILAAIFSTDSKHLFTLAGESFATAPFATAHIWDPATGKEFSRFELKLERTNLPAIMPDRIEFAAFSPDGSRLATLTPNGGYIWETQSGSRAANLEVQGAGDVWPRAFISRPSEQQLAFSPDGLRLAVAMWDQTGRIWDVRTGKPLVTLRGHKDKVHAVAFSPNGQMLVTASEDTTVRVWVADSGEEYFTLRGHVGPVYSARFSRDGRFVVTASADGTARIWPVDPLPVALARKPRELTAEERTRFEVEHDDIGSERG
jgi:WD40 repeat protein/serine/threonine protein kinase